MRTIRKNYLYFPMQMDYGWLFTGRAGQFHLKLPRSVILDYFIYLIISGKDCVELSDFN